MHSVDELKQRLIQFWSFQAHFMNSLSPFTVHYPRWRQCWVLPHRLAQCM